MFLSPLSLKAGQTKVFTRKKSLPEGRSEARCLKQDPACQRHGTDHHLLCGGFLLQTTICQYKAKDCIFFIYTNKLVFISLNLSWFSHNRSITANFSHNLTCPSQTIAPVLRIVKCLLPFCSLYILYPPALPNNDLFYYKFKEKQSRCALSFAQPWLVTQGQNTF